MNWPDRDEFMNPREVGDGFVICDIDDSYSGMMALREAADRSYGEDFRGPGFLDREILNTRGENVMDDPLMIFSYVSWRSFNPLWTKRVLFRFGSPYAYLFGSMCGWRAIMENADLSIADGHCATMRESLMPLMDLQWAGGIGEMDDYITVDRLSHFRDEAGRLALDADPSRRRDGFWLSYFGRDAGMMRGFMYDIDRDVRMLAASLLMFSENIGVPDSALRDEDPAIRSCCLFGAGPQEIGMFMDDPDERVQKYLIHSGSATVSHFMHLAENSRFDEVRALAAMRLAAE